jgi:hypothetical protein
VAQLHRVELGGRLPESGLNSGAMYSSFCSETVSSGLWRSLVAHLTGGQGVAGSNPVSPTEMVM